jgi:D-alanine-D-alanine ligase
MKTIAVIFGGRSTEHDVSIVTAIASVIKPLEATKQCQVEPVYIAKDGSWYWDQKLKDIVLFQSGEIDEFMRRAPKVHLLFDDGLTLIKSSNFAGRKMYRKIDVVFPAMHGTYGEDGSLMGLLEMADVPYVGYGLAASTIAMDKVLTKQVTGASGIPSTPWMWFYGRELSEYHEKILSKIKTLRYPLFVKPAHLGSSIGISRVKEESELMNALEVAIHYDDKVIVEQGVQNLIEVTLPVIGNDQLTPSLLERPLLKAEDFFDFDTKYIAPGGKKGKGKGGKGYSEAPAKLPENLYAKAEKVGLDSYKAVGGSGIARVDLLIDSKKEEVYLNEINPMPGDLYRHNWAKAGISSVDLVIKLVDLAEERFKARQKIATSFSTNYLKQF